MAYERREVQVKESLLGLRVLYDVIYIYIVLLYFPCQTTVIEFLTSHGISARAVLL